MSGRMEATLDHVQLLVRHLNGCEPQYVVIAILLELGIATERDGFAYLIHAIVLFVENPAQRFVKGIYTTVGRREENGVEGRLVELSIRRVIEDAWEHRDESVWSCYFRQLPDGTVRKPTNSEFISVIGYFVILYQGCCRKEAIHGRAE